VPAPTTPETTAEAKSLVTQFVNDKFKVMGFTNVEIDCAHRVGKVLKEKQTMLVRLFERDLIDLLLSKKKLLKGSGQILFEDATLLDRKLINALNDHDNVESAWMSHGTIWAKGIAGGPKIKVKFFDNIDELFP
jgi:predicted nucleotidyltransferase